MAETSGRDETQDTRGGFPWARSRFDMEGVVAAIAALVTGVLFGTLWSPLFLLGLIGAGMALLGSRYASRVVPDADDAVAAPVDGVVESITVADVPDDLRLPDTEARRIRISSGPYATVAILAPVTGSVAHVTHFPGNQGTVLASNVNDPGLETSHTTIQSGTISVGVVAMTGAFGPRLEMNVEAGDMVRIGRRIGKRRLGGWCDVYLPLEADVVVVPGQTLVSGETVLAVLDAVSDGGEAYPRVEPAEAPKVDPLESAAVGAGDEEPPLEEIEDEVEEAVDELIEEVEEDLEAEAEALEDTTETTEETAEEMFARLRKRAEEAGLRDEDEDEEGDDKASDKGSDKGRKKR